MCKFEKNLNRIYTLSGVILIIIVIMAMSSCGTTKEIKKCCEETTQEIYIYEGLYVDCENCDEID
jgi:hypothetical protein